LRVVFRRRIWHYLYALDLVGGDLVQRKRCLLAIQEDGRRAVAEGDITRSVDAERGDLAHGILGGTAFAGEALIDIEDLFIDLGLEDRAMGDDGYRLHLCGDGGEPDGA